MTRLPVEGRVMELPDEISSVTAAEAGLYPVVLDAERVGYRWDFNLWVMIAAPLFLLCLFGLAYELWHGTSITKHAAIAPLKRFGDHADVLKRIESDLWAAGPVARCEPFWITKDWIVTTAPLRIFATRDVKGIGLHSEMRKTGPHHEIRIWIAGSVIEERIALEALQAQTATTRIAAVMPSVIVDDVDAFGRRWRENRGEIA